MNPLQERNPVQILHYDVGQDQVVGVQFESCQGFPAARGQLDLISLTFECGTNHGPDVRLIVNDQNACRLSDVSDYARFCFRGYLFRGVRCSRSCQVHFQTSSSGTPVFRATASAVPNGPKSSPHDCMVLVLVNKCLIRLTITKKG